MGNQAVYCGNHGFVAIGTLYLLSGCYKLFKSGCAQSPPYITTSEILFSVLYCGSTFEQMYNQLVLDTLSIDFHTTTRTEEGERSILWTPPRTCFLLLYCFFASTLLYGSFYWICISSESSACLSAGCDPKCWTFFVVTH
jgi:hypothetical protein